MAAKQLDAWLFVVEWFDPMPQLKKTYVLKYFVDQHMAEMVDANSKKMFLKKSVCPPEMTSSDFFIGGKLLLYSRELTIVDYGDLKTRNLLEQQSQKSLVILPSGCFTSWGNIIDNLLRDFNLVAMQTISLPPNIADSVAEVVEESQSVANFLSRGTALLLIVHAKNGVVALARACAELQNEYNCVLITPSSPTQVSTLLSSTFKAALQTPTAALTKCTCCIIKPHAVKNKASGAIIAQIISEGYDISAISTVMFDRTTAEEFLEVYKGVVPEYGDHVVQLCSGLSVVLEVRAEEDAVYSFRNLAGPWDVEIAKEIRPQSIRAKHGYNRILSGVHCTDLETDGSNECEYCFYILTSVLVSN